MNKEELKFHYNNYIDKISNAGMVISFETSFFMYDLCNKMKFKLIMERGIGFSTFVLRTYMKEQDFPVEVFSIETEMPWLQKNEVFLKENNLSVDNLWMWDDFFLKKHGKKFNFILEDARFNVRTSTYKKLISFIDEDGFILWDDANNNTHKSIIKECCDKLKFIRYEETKAETTDNFKRFSMLTARKENLDIFKKLS